MKKISAILVVLILASASLFAWEGKEQKRLEQQNSGKKIHPKRIEKCENNEFGMKLEMMEELELSNSQIKKMEKIKTNHRKQQIRFKADIEILKIDKREAMKNKNFANAKKINSEISKLKLQMANAKIDKQAAIWTELTEEQKEKAKHK